MDQIIYVLINEAMPGYAKIGHTENLERRIRELDQTNVPLPFECFYACTVKNAKVVEKRLHDAFLDHRVRSNREFFEISPERVMSALKLAEIQDITPKKDFVESQEDQKALNRARKRRNNFNFGMVNIPKGAELSFVKDKNIKVKVINNKSVEFNNKITSLSRIAQEILEVDYPVQGPIYWIYEGETLDARRARFESEE